MDVFAFAEKYLAPFSVSGREIVPEICPFCHGGVHRDRNTFYISIETGAYCCHRASCSARGSFTSLLKMFGEKGGEPFSMGLSQNNTPNFKSRKTYRLPSVPLLPATEAIYAYFQSRGISRGTVDAYHVGASPRGDILFPFYEEGTHVYSKFRSVVPPQPGEPFRKELPERDTKPVLFGMDLCSFSFPLVVTEGELDAMSLAEAGVNNAVSVPAGAMNLNWIETCYDWLRNFSQIILFGDNDEPGRQMVDAVARRLDFAPVYIVTRYPDRKNGDGTCKDANEILCTYGVQDIIDAIQNAEPFEIQGLINLADVEPVDPTTIPRVRSGILALDRALGGFAEGDLTVLTGKRGEGKSTISGEFIGNAIAQGWKACCYSGELSKEEFQMWLHFQFAGSDYIGIKYDPVAEENVPYIDPDIARRIRAWYDGKLFLFDNCEVFGEDTYRSILSVFSQAAGRLGCKFFLVDNLLISTADTDEEELKVQKRFTNALKQFAKRWNAHVMLVAHPRKTPADKPLSNDDVAGNAAITNLADNVMSIEKPDIRVTKSRGRGRLTLISCCYAPDSRRIYAANDRDHYQFDWDRSGVKRPPRLASSLPEFGIQIKQTSPF